MYDAVQHMNKLPRNTFLLYRIPRKQDTRLRIVAKRAGS